MNGIEVIPEIKAKKISSLKVKKTSVPIQKHIKFPGKRNKTFIYTS